MSAFATYTDAEIERWLHARAIEWCAWPLYLSQASVPMLLVFFPIIPVLGTLLVLDILWRIIRYHFVSWRLAYVGAMLVQFLEWPLALLATVCLLVQKRYGVAALAFLWPLGAGLFNAPITLLGAFFGFHTQRGRVELALAKRIGYAQLDAQL